MSDQLYALLIDDDQLNCASLKYMLEHDCQGIEVIGTAYHAEEGRQFLRNAQQQPDVVFLDIQMPDESGFDFLASLPNRNFDVVFATAFDDYVLRALKVSAVDYLVKPIAIDELQEAVDKLRNHQRARKENQNQLLIENLLHNLQDVTQSRIALPHITGVKFVTLSEISFLEADSNYTIVHLSNLQKIVVSRTLKEFEDLLPSEQFMRVHKSNIVNLQFVREYVGVHGGELLLTDGNSVGISKSSYTEFMNRMKKFSLSFKRHA